MNSLSLALDAPMDKMDLKTQAFRCAIGNNASGPLGHEAGYNGLWALTACETEDNLIAERLSGLNLEHYFNGRDEDTKKPEVLFDPRYSAMEFRRESDSQCCLYQPPTNFYGVESWSDFTVSEPRYLDMSFRCVPRKDIFPFGWLGVFWATYVPTTEDTSIFFLAYETAEQKKPTWHQSAGKMYYSRQAKVPLRFEGPMKSHAMASMAPVRWAEPFYYGLWREYVYIVMFDTEHDLGMYAGQCPLRWNPWDFQIVIHNPKISSEYRLRVRMVVDRFEGRKQVIDEYSKWRSLSD